MFCSILQIKRMAHYAEKFHEIILENTDASTYENNPESRWVYAGGSSGSHLNYYLLKFKRSPPALVDKCICSHPITENCYIQNIDSEVVLPVGNCCIKKFLDEDNQGRTCELCHKPHQNRSDNFCNECRGGRVNFGKYFGKSFISVLEQDPSYCHWVLHSGEEYASKFRDWLKTQKIPEPVDDGKIKCGKYKGMSYQEVYDVDQKYCHWIKDKIGEGVLLPFKMWLLRK